MTQFSPTPDTFAQRLAAVSQQTGLSPAQLGVARVYDRPHVDSASRASHLSGEELLVKDTQQVAGEWVTMGNARQGFRAAHSDTAVENLLATGARLVGASASAEYGTSAYTEPVGQEAPVNPISPSMMTGGSSGGAAAAVGHGVARIAHATDGGGSIRVPAACCGLVGLKPAHDTAVGGFNPSAHGYLAASFANTRKAYQLPRTRPWGLRVGYTNQPFHHHSRVDPAIAAATAGATALLTNGESVAEVRQAPQPYDPANFELFATVLSTRCAELPEPLSELTSWLKRQGTGVPRWRREEMERSIHRMSQTALHRWSSAGLDVVATPMLACAPPAPGSFSRLSPRLNFWAQTAWTPWGTLWNLCGWASVTVPLVDPARVPGRWPIALQLGAVGDRVSASDLVALAEQVQAAAAALPVEGLSLAEPGDLSSLNYEPRPGAGNHDAGCDCAGSRSAGYNCAASHSAESHKAECGCTAGHSHESCGHGQP